MIAPSIRHRRQPSRGSGHSVLGLILLLLTALFLATSLDAQPQKASPSKTQQILEGFDERLRQIDARLVEGKPHRAYKLADQLLKEMMHQFISGSAIGRYLGIGTVLKAIAAYQLGNEDEALWHWHVACQLWPPAEKLKMTAYGDAGPFLKSRLLSEVTKKTPKAEPEVPSVSTPKGNVRPPRKKNTPRPEFPLARLGESVSVKVRVVVGKNGRPRWPKIVDSKGELTMVFATLDVLRRWEFKPATLNGEPVEVYYNLQANFNTRR